MYRASAASLRPVRDIVAETSEQPESELAAMVWVVGFRDGAGATREKRARAECEASAGSLNAEVIRGRAAGADK